MNILNELKTEHLKGKLIRIRQELHENPEISDSEFETTRRIKKWLVDTNCNILNLQLKTGVVAEISGLKEGPTVAFRADIDALSIKETTGLPYASKVEGVSHACGHDWHTTIALGAAIILSENRDKFNGTVRFIFQPAEETTQGAQQLIEAGLFDDGKIKAIFGLHNQPSLPAGSIGLTSSQLMAAVDTLKIHVKGKTGHGAIPQMTVDAVVAASAVVMGLQTIISRNIDPFDPVVITIGSLTSGTTHNVIADEAYLLGTVRSFSPSVRKQLPDLIERTANNIALGYGATAEVEYIPQVPAINNNEEMTKVVKKAIEDVLGNDGIVKPQPTMGGEDFSLYQEHVPGCFFWVGSGDKEKGISKGWHASDFLVNDEIIPQTVELVAKTLLYSLDHFERRSNE